ncbi:MAG: methionine ABC transporter permease [Anaerovoracaceae bacterium]|nr:ABC transporter permease [Bacillota bacterium]MDY2671027.1 methionine ABC transporter permease [Anaerovoracaceae bacterium]
MGSIPWDLIGQGFLETLEMSVVSTMITYIIGLPMGVILSFTGPQGLHQNKAVYGVIGAIVNIVRSIPFLILLVLLIPVTRFIVGTSLGTAATCVPLTIGTIPIVARMVEQSLQEVPAGIKESALAMGASPWQVIRLFILPEAVPSLILGATINFLTILGYSAMAGFVGGGGLGDIAVRYGYYRYDTEILLVTVVILIVIVQVVQEIGTKLASSNKHD